MVDHFTEEEIALVYEVFRQYSVEHEGVLELKNMPTVMLALGHNPTNEELDKIIRVVVDKDDRTSVDFPEFLTMLAFHVQETEPEDQLREAFKVFDKDGNGSVSAGDLLDTMKLLGENISKDEIEYMVRMADIDGDGQVNYEEFIRVMFSR